MNKITFFATLFAESAARIEAESALELPFPSVCAMQAVKNRAARAAQTPLAPDFGEYFGISVNFLKRLFLS